MDNVVEFPIQFQTRQFYQVEEECYIHPVAIAMFGVGLPVCTYIHDQPLRRRA